MGTMVETDIDKFIKDQKAKLAEERQAVGLNVSMKLDLEKTWYPC